MTKGLLISVVVVILLSIASFQMFRYKSEFEHLQIDSKDAQIAELQADLSSARQDLVQRDAEVAKLNETLMSIPFMNEPSCVMVSEDWNETQFISSICLYRKQMVTRIVLIDMVSRNLTDLPSEVRGNVTLVGDNYKVWFGVENVYNEILILSDGVLHVRVAEGKKPDWLDEAFDKWLGSYENPDTSEAFESARDEWFAI